LALLGLRADLVYAEATAAFAKKSPHEVFFCSETFFLGLPDPLSALRQQFFPSL
jgi:hypothetical protein